MIEFSGKSKSTRHYIIVAVVVGIVAFIIGILIGRFAACDEGSPEPATFERFTKEADPDVSELLINEISASNIEENLRRLTEKPHIAGRQADFDLAAWIKQEFINYGLDSVRSAPYKVLLNYPDSENPNRVELLSAANDSTIFDSTTAESDVSHLEGVVRPFLAYSPSDVVEGEMVYVNYGRVEDYDYLDTKGLKVEGKIVLARYGKIFRGSKVAIAQRHKAIGVVLFSDPADYTDPNDTRVFPETVWLPPTAAQRGSILVGVGDPLTPGYPATSTAFRLQENDTEVNLPKIPAQCIGYAAAEHFLRELGGEEVPEDWRGRIKGLTYRFGPTNSSRIKVRLTTTTSNSIRQADNVIGIIKGAVEPDRYVLMGNHRDAWVYGSFDPSSATAVMMEVARAMAHLAKTGRWRPRRSIMFCSWGAEEYMLIGSTEWAEEYVKSLGARAVAYINVDIAVQGNYSLRALGTPLLYRPLYEATKKVPNPNPDELSAGRRTVYDTWKHSFPKEGQDLPVIKELGAGSDYAPMLQIAGITAVDFRYTYDSNTYDVGSYPLYHTEYETFETMRDLVDNGFEYHRAVARVAVEILRSLGDSLIIPFNVSDFAVRMEEMGQELDKEYGSILKGNVTDYAKLSEVIQGFSADVKNFEETVSSIDKKNPMAVRMVNDQLLLLEKAFLDPQGLPDRPLKKHLVFADSANNAYGGSSFPGLVDLLFGIEDLTGEEQGARWNRVRKHFSVLLHTIKAAGYTLRNVVDFVEETY